MLTEELHFGRAAHLCGVSQPAMSRLLSELETELGVKLIERTSRSVSLTTAGKGVLASARQAVMYADIAVRACAYRTRTHLPRRFYFAAGSTISTLL